MVGYYVLQSRRPWRLLMVGYCVLQSRWLMSAYFCPHLMFNSRYLIEFVCLKSDLIDNSDN